MHSKKIINNINFDNVNEGYCYIELQPGLSVSIVTAKQLNAVDSVKKFSGCDDYLCFNCQLQGRLNLKVKDRELCCSQGDLTFGFSDGETFCLQHSDDFCNVEVMVMPELLGVLLGDMNSMRFCLGEKRDFFLHHYNIELDNNVLSCARQLFYLMCNSDCRVSNRLLLYANVLKYLDWYFHACSGQRRKQECNHHEYQQINKAYDYLLNNLSQPPTIDWLVKPDSQWQKQEFSHREYNQINVARDYLLSNLSDPPTIDWLAKQVGLNQNKLKKGFKHVFGKSIYAYFLAERMNKARQLLIDNSVTETAMIMGYSNISHFSSAFRKQFGVLPKEVRRQHAYTFL